MGQNHHPGLNASKTGILHCPESGDRTSKQTSSDEKSGKLDSSTRLFLKLTLNEVEFAYYNFKTFKTFSLKVYKF